MSVTQSTASDIDVDLGKLFSSLARNWLRILVVALAIAGLVFVMAWMATPHYKAETRLLIETRESVFTRPDATADNQPILDEEGVTSQVEVISSTDILKRVARQLNLSKLPEFDSAANLSLPARLLVIAGLKNDPTEVPPDERVLKAFREKLTVYRVERSRVIVIEFSSEDPKLAAAVPNAIADAYLSVSRDAKLASNSDATEWLEPEIADLSKRVKEAEARVADFRAKSDLLIGQNNSVLATQQLSELSTELSRVRAGRAASEANAQSMRRALEKGGSLDALPEVMSSPLIQRLRERQVQLKSDIADLSTTLLENHPRIRALKSQLTDLDAQMVVEARNILKGIVTEVQTATLRETQLTADLNQLKAASARAGEQEVELRALERDAASQRQLLESYTTRYREAASRQDRNYLPVDARVFSRAIAPSEPYFPKIVPMVGAAFIGSLLIMAVITLLQELFSGRAMRAAPGSRFEPVEQVKMPMVNAQADDGGDAPAPVVLNEDSAGPDWITDEIGIVRAAEKLIAEGTMRAVFVSPQGDEAAAAAVMVAREVSDAGLRVLLLDLTTGGAASQPMLDSVRFPGITNLLATGAQFNNVIHGDLYSDCHVIPIGTDDPEQAMRAADRLPIILKSLTTAYDLVVIECGIIDADGIRRLVGENTEIFVSVLEPGNQVTAAAEDLKAGGYQGFIMVTPVGYDAPDSPRPSRSVA